MKKKYNSNPLFHVITPIYNAISYRSFVLIRLGGGSPAVQVTSVLCPHQELEKKARLS